MERRRGTPGHLAVQRGELRFTATAAQVIVAPMTTKSRPSPFRVPLSHGGKKGLILLDQIRAVDKVRLAKKMGSVSAKTLSLALDTLKDVFAKCFLRTCRSCFTNLCSCT